jgi:PAS domain S-box-containing protein
MIGNDWLITAHALADATTGVAFLSIPLAIYYYLRKRKDIEYRWVAHLFAIFIALCGIENLIHAIQPLSSHPVIDTVSTILTAGASAATAALLWGIMPKLLTIPCSGMLRRSFEALQAEVRRRFEAEQAVRESRLVLEQRVSERTRQLAEKEERLRLATEMADLGTWDHGPTPQWSVRAKQIFGRTADWQPGVGDIWRAILPEDRLRVRTSLQAASDPVRRAPINVEFRVRHPDETVHWVIVLGKALFEDGMARPVRLIGVMKDITDKKNWETRLQQSEARFRDLTNALPQIVWTNDSTAAITYVNDRWREMTGTDGHCYEVRGRFYHPDDAEPIRAAWKQSLAAGTPFEYEARWFDIRCNDYRWHLLRAVPVHHEDGTVCWYGTSTDIHEQKKNEAALAASVAEKETLLREIHHRVKNNLQSLWALLQLEKFAMKDGEARSRLDAVSDRITIMGNIHRQLYKSNNLAMIDFGAHISEVARNLVRMNQGREEIILDLATEPLLCDLDVAIPLGLIVNEILTNAIKHAFPGDRSGTLRVSFHRDGDAVRLEIADNGVGLPEAGENGVGSMLISALADQVGATVTTVSDAGTTVVITLAGSKFVEDADTAPGRTAA